MHHVFDHYGDYSGDIVTRREGAMVSWETGVTTTYALHNAQDRGILFVGAGEGLCRPNRGPKLPRDLDINVCKKEAFDEYESLYSDETLRLTPHRVLSLEDALQWIKDDGS